MFPKLHKQLSDDAGRDYDDSLGDDTWWFVAGGKPFSIQDDVSGHEIISCHDGKEESIAVFMGDPENDTLEGDPGENDPGFTYEDHLWYVALPGKESSPAVRDLLSL